VQDAPRHRNEPASSLWERLASIWAEVLGVERIGRDADFFELGGQSLLAVQIVSRVRDEYGVRPQAAALFLEPRFEDFVALVARLLTSPEA
jgi:acyl carrier protein